MYTQVEELVNERTKLMSLTLRLRRLVLARKLVCVLLRMPALIASEVVRESESRAFDGPFFVFISIGLLLLPLAGAEAAVAGIAIESMSVLLTGGALSGLI